MVLTLSRKAQQHEESTQLISVHVDEHHAAPRKKSMLVPALIICVGVIVLMYPIVATQWNNVQQHRVVSEYQQFIEESDPAMLEAEIQRAREYNSHRTQGPILDPWLARYSRDNEPYKEYIETLALDDVMARVQIPSIHVDLPVLHGTDIQTLSKAAGHLFGTDLPVGGAGTHSVITAHTGLQTSTLFDNLVDVKEGDSIYIDVYGEKLRYVVYGTEVVLPDEADNLYPDGDRDLLTLITCTPYGINSHRLLVHAERAPIDDESAAEAAWSLPIQWWMYAFAGVALLGIVALIATVRKSRKNHVEAGEATAIGVTASLREEGDRE